MHHSATLVVDTLFLLAQSHCALVHIMLLRGIFSIAALAGYATAFPFTSDLRPRAACDGNTATTRSEWCDYSIDVDPSDDVPDTGVTREYWLELTDVTVAPDGVSRSAMAVNG